LYIAKKDKEPKNMPIINDEAIAVWNNRPYKVLKNPDTGEPFIFISPKKQVYLKNFSDEDVVKNRDLFHSTLFRQDPNRKSMQRLM
jgi:hypothetical protein